MQKKLHKRENYILINGHAKLHNFVGLILMETWKQNLSPIITPN